MTALSPVLLRELRGRDMQIGTSRGAMLHAREYGALAEQTE